MNLKKETDPVMLLKNLVIRSALKQVLGNRAYWSITLSKGSGGVRPMISE
jgi:hypothetical protein